MDQPCSVLLFVLTGSVNFALLPHFAPTAHHARKQGQIDLIFIIQVDFPGLSLPLQLLQASRFLLVFWVRAANQEDRTLPAGACSVQGATHAAFAHYRTSLLFEGQRQQLGDPVILPDFPQLFRRFI
jgi:hypothetical protein